MGARLGGIAGWPGEGGPGTAPPGSGAPTGGTPADAWPAGGPGAGCWAIAIRNGASHWIARTATTAMATARLGEAFHRLTLIGFPFPPLRSLRTLRWDIWAAGHLRTLASRASLDPKPPHPSRLPCSPGAWRSDREEPAGGRHYAVGTRRRKGDGSASIPPTIAPICRDSSARRPLLADLEDLHGQRARSLIHEQVLGSPQLILPPRHPLPSILSGSSAYCLPLSAFCSLPPAFCLLLTALCLLPYSALGSWSRLTCSSASPSGPGPSAPLR